MTQEELAEKLDLSINYVGALERAEKNLTVTCKRQEKSRPVLEKN